MPYDDATASASIAAQVDQVNNKTVYLCDNAANTTIGTASADPTPAALLLVGQKVPVKVVAENAPAPVQEAPVEVAPEAETPAAE